MIEEHANLVHFHIVRIARVLGLVNVFAILAAAGVATEAGRDERQNSLRAGGFEFGDCVRHHRVPVAVAPFDGHVDLVCLQLCFQRGDQFPALIIDGTDASEMVVVLGDFQQSFAGHIPAAKHVFQKGDYVVRAFRATEGNEQNRVVLSASHVQIVVSAQRVFRQPEAARRKGERTCVPR